MKDKKELMDKLEKDYKDIENKVYHQKLYNIRSFCMRTLIKSGLLFDYFFPFIISSLLIGQHQEYKKNHPFTVDEITAKEKYKIETLDTSTGIHKENISKDFDYDKQLFEHSTAWTINKYGLYERVVTSYRLADEIDIDKLNVDKIFSMTEEEIKSIFTIIDKKNIQKNNLDSEDSIYEQDVFVIINHSELERDVIREENGIEYILNSGSYLILLLFLRYGLVSIEKIFFKNYIHNSLKKSLCYYKKIKNEDLQKLVEILKIKQENLLMIEGKDDINEYRLRKIRGVK